MKKQLLKNASVIITSAIVSYLLNCYYYNTFDPTKFDLAAKICSTLIIIVVLLIHTGITQEIKPKPLCQHDWQPDKYSPNDKQTCVVCDKERGIVR